MDNDIANDISRHIVYICSRYQSPIAEVQRAYIDYAKDLTRRALKCGFAPIVPHLYLPTVLDDNCAEERKIGLWTGIALLDRCSKVIVGELYGISSGMEREIDYAQKHRIPIERWDSHKKQRH